MVLAYVPLEDRSADLVNLGTRFRGGGGLGGGGHSVEAFEHPGQVVEEHVSHIAAEVLAGHDANSVTSSAFAGRWYAGTIQPCARRRSEMS